MLKKIRYYVFDLEKLTLIYCDNKMIDEKLLTDQTNEICIIGIKHFPVYVLTSNKIIIFNKKDQKSNDISDINEISSICDRYTFEDESSFDMVQVKLKDSKIQMIMKMIKNDREIEFVEYEIE